VVGGETDIVRCREIPTPAVSPIMNPMATCRGLPSIDETGNVDAPTGDELCEAADWLFTRPRRYKFSVSRMAEDLGWQAGRTQVILRHLAGIGLIGVAQRFGYSRQAIGFRVSAFVGDFGELPPPMA
jgi:hypothetical protein